MLNSLLTSSYCQIWDFIPMPITRPVSAGLVFALDDKVSFTSIENIEYNEDSDFQFTHDTRSIFRSINGGTIWEEIIFNKETELDGTVVDIYATSHDTIFISYFDNKTSRPYLYRTFDGGSTWQKDNFGITYYLNFVRFFDSKNGIGIGDPNDEGFFEIITTNDGGVTWIKQPNQLESKNEYVSISSCKSKDNFWFTTTKRRILHTTDRGVTWNVIENPKTLTGRMVIRCDENSTLYLSHSEFGNDIFSVYRKEFNETEWQSITYKDSIGFILDMVTIPSTNSIVINSYKNKDLSTCRTIASTNRGDKWQEVDFDRGLPLGQMSFSSPKTGYSIQLPKSFDLPTTGIFKYNNSPLSGLFSYKILDASVTLLPNPAQEVISVKLTTDDPQDFWILINDLDGKLMAKKAISDVSSFTETIRIDHLPAGSYIVKVLSPKGQYASPFVKL